MKSKEMQVKRKKERVGNQTFIRLFWDKHNKRINSVSSETSKTNSDPNAIEAVLQSNTARRARVWLAATATKKSRILLLSA